MGVKALFKSTVLGVHGCESTVPLRVVLEVHGCESTVPLRVQCWEFLVWKHRSFENTVLGVYGCEGTVPVRIQCWEFMGVKALFRWEYSIGSSWLWRHCSLENTVLGVHGCESTVSLEYRIGSSWPYWEFMNFWEVRYYLPGCLDDQHLPYCCTKRLLVFFVCWFSLDDQRFPNQLYDI